MAAKRAKKKTAKKSKTKRKPFSRRYNKSSPKAVECALKHADWCQKRIEGWNYTDIANWSDVTSGCVRNAVLKRMATVGLDDARDLLRLDLARLDQMLKQLWPLAFGKSWVDLEYVDRILKTLDQRRRLLQPVLSDIVTPDEGLPTIFDIMCSKEFAAYIKDRDNGAGAPTVIDVEVVATRGNNGGNGAS